MARLAIAAPLVLFAAGPAFAESVFTVENVAIDAEAASAADARARALADGQRTALEILLRRLTVTGARKTPPMPDAAALAAMVESFSIAGERVAPTRYRAALTVDFDPRAVRRLLRDNRIAYAETVGRPVLLVAVLRRPLGARLWGEGNPWRRAWEERPPPRGLVPIVLPLGDVVDLGLVDAARALAPEREALADWRAATARPRWRWRLSGRSCGGWRKTTRWPRPSRRRSRCAGSPAAATASTRRR